MNRRRLQFCPFGLIYITSYNWGSGVAIASSMSFFRKKGANYLEEGRAGGNHEEQRLTEKKLYIFR